MDERREDMINSRVTFLLKRTLSRYETSLGQMLPSQAPPLLQLCLRGLRLKRDVKKKKEKKSFHAEHSSALAHEAVKRDEREKLMHGIADPLTKLSLCTHRGAALTTRSVRESGDAAGKRRRARARLTRRTRLSKAGHVRRLFTRSFSLGKT